jgi:trimethylamine--corrinoid protein Co-methyltransferase
MQSGRFQPLTPSGIEQIHETALRLLAEVGLGDATESGIEIMIAAGCSRALRSPTCAPIWRWPERS